MTMLEQLEVEPEVVRELHAQCVQSVEDLVAMAAQPNERAALLEDLRWTEPGLQAVLEKAHRILPRTRHAQASSAARPH